MGYHGYKGTLVNTNTIEEFRTTDKNQLFQQVTEKVIKPRNGMAVYGKKLMMYRYKMQFKRVKR